MDKERKNSRSLNTIKDWILSIIGFVVRTFVGIGFWFIAIECTYESFVVGGYLNGEGFGGILLLFGIITFIAGFICIFPICAFWLFTQLIFRRKDIDEVMKNALYALFLYFRSRDIFYMIYQAIKNSNIKKARVKSR